MRERLQALNQVDLGLTRRFRLESNQCAWWRSAVILAHSGDSWLWAIGVGLVWLFTFAGSPYWHRLSAILETSIVIQALFVFALKRKIKRQRPNGDWGGIYRQIDPHSFPSGHATRAMMLAVMTLQLGPAWLGWLLLIWTPLVCLSRVMTGVHYLSDIFGGLVLGALLAGLFLALTPYWIQWLPFLY